ncbi:hypothetical protein K1719_004568 [Acacia pycnantha]|nr:hypothetical protein K1719_004568 [Acacia pycnantha]
MALILSKKGSMENSSSSEEEDLVLRSVKKVKGNEGTSMDVSMGNEWPALGKESGKPWLKGPSFAEKLQGIGRKENGGINTTTVNELSDDPLSEPDDIESDKDEHEPLCIIKEDPNRNFPTFSFSDKMKKRLYKAWDKAVIVKLLGRDIGYMLLQSILQPLWAKREGECTKKKNLQKAVVTLPDNEGKPPEVNMESGEASSPDFDVWKVVSKPRRQRRGGKEKVVPAAQRLPSGSRFEVLVVDGGDVGGDQVRPSPDVSTGVSFKAKRESSGNEGVDKKWKVNKKQGRGKSRAGEKKMGEGNKSEKRTREDMRKGDKERKSLSINSEVSYGKKQVVSEVTGEQEGELMIVGPKVGSVAGDVFPDGGVFSSVQIDPGAKGVLNRIEGKFWNGPKALDPDDMWEEEAQAPNISLGVEELGSFGDMGVVAHEMSEGGSVVPETQDPANIRTVCRSSKPSFLFLSETKCENEGQLSYLSKLGFDGSAFVPSNGRSGGLFAVWKKDQISIDVLRRERQFIHFRCSVPGKGVFFLTSVYAIPRTELKQSLWQELSSLSSSMSGSWVLAGDFNDILSADERTGGVGVNFSRIDLFQNRILSCDLLDLGFHGPKFTWRGPQSFNCSRLYERLDKALGNTNFLSEFSACSVQVPFG